MTQKLMEINKDSVLKVLILLGLTAIAISLYIQYLAPYLHQRALQKLDEQRISDLNSLNKAVQAVASSTNVVLGVANTVYVSLPSASSTCGDLNLPSLAEGWQYHCTPASKVQNTDGTGWLPINLKNSNTSKISELPIDPINNADTLNYYAFVASSTATSSEYVITSVLDSKKYLIPKAQTDGGIDPIRYEAGNDMILWAKAQGLIYYWPFSEGEGNKLIDEMGGRDGIISNNPQWETGSDCYLKSCIKLDNNNQEILLGKLSENRLNNLTILLWVNLQRNSEESYELFSISNLITYYAYNSEENLGTVAAINETNENQVFLTPITHTTYNTWHQVGLILDGESLGNILDGKIINEIPFEGNINLDSSLMLNPRGTYTGLLNDLRIYDRTLSSIEIQRYDDINSK